MTEWTPLTAVSQASSREILPHSAHGPVGGAHCRCTVVSTSMPDPHLHEQQAVAGAFQRSGSGSPDALPQRLLRLTHHQRPTLTTLLAALPLLQPLLLVCSVPLVPLGWTRGRALLPVLLVLLELCPVDSLGCCSMRVLVL